MEDETESGLCLPHDVFAEPGYLLLSGTGRGEWVDVGYWQDTSSCIHVVIGGLAVLEKKMRTVIHGHCHLVPVWWY